MCSFIKMTFPCYDNHPKIILEKVEDFQSWCMKKVSMTFHSFCYRDTNKQKFFHRLTINPCFVTRVKKKRRLLKLLYPEKINTYFFHFHSDGKEKIIFKKFFTWKSYKNIRGTNIYHFFSHWRPLITITSILWPAGISTTENPIFFIRCEKSCEKMISLAKGQGAGEYTNHLKHH